MSNDATYNGWSNRATWLVNLWYGEALADMVYDKREIDAQAAESVVEHSLEYACDSGPEGDLLRLALSQVNWQEIANAANA